MKQLNSTKKSKTRVDNVIMVVPTGALEHLISVLSITLTLQHVSNSNLSSTVIFTNLETKMNSEVGFAVWGIT